jgi:hypothetical protein
MEKPGVMETIHAAVGSLFPALGPGKQIPPIGTQLWKPGGLSDISMCSSPKWKCPYALKTYGAIFLQPIIFGTVGTTLLLLQSFILSV